MKIKPSENKKTSSKNYEKCARNTKLKASMGSFPLPKRVQNVIYRSKHALLTLFKFFKTSHLKNIITSAKLPFSITLLLFDYDMPINAKYVLVGLLFYLVCQKNMIRFSLSEKKGDFVFPFYGKNKEIYIDPFTHL